MHGILVDAGISGTAIRKSLKNLGISMQAIMGVLVTHNHTDHTRGLYQLMAKNNLTACTTPAIRAGIISPKSKISLNFFREKGSQE